MSHDLNKLFEKIECLRGMPMIAQAQQGLPLLESAVGVMAEQERRLSVLSAQVQTLISQNQGQI